MSITKIAINRPSLIVVFFTAILLIGGFCFTKLNYELFPEMSTPTLIVSTPYPGAAPNNVEQTVTKKIEDEICSVDGIKNVTSQSMEGISLVVAEFNAGTDINDKQQEVQRKLNNILSDLPSDVKTPTISKMTPSDQPIIQLTATSNLPNASFYDLVKNEIKPQLQQIKGIGEIKMVGGQEREIQVNVNKDKLEHYGLSILQVTKAINNANTEFPTGKVKTRNAQMTVRLTGKFTSVEQMKNLSVAQPATGSAIKLCDIADVSDVTKEQTAINRYNGKEGIGIIIKKQSNANAVEISNEVKAKIASIEKQYISSNTKIVIANDTSDFTMESVNSVGHDLVIAIMLVAVIMILFLHSVRDSFIVLLAIPTSLISSFIAMYLCGYSLNLMTLLALSLVIGILVDDSIVVLENIHRHLSLGKSKYQAALDGINEIGFSALAITLVIVVVFAPMAFINNTIGDVLRQFSLTIVTATLTSLAVCYTLTPWLSSKFGKITELDNNNWLHKPLIQFERLIEKITEWYTKQLHWVMCHKITFLSIIFTLFAGVYFMMQMGILGSELVAGGDQAKFQLKLEFDKTTTVTENNLQTKAIEDYLLSQPEVKMVFSNIAGPSTTGMESMKSVGSEYKSELLVKLVEKEKRTLSTEKYMIEIGKRIEAKFPGVKLRSTTLGIVNSGEPIQIILNSTNNELLMKTANELKRKIETLPGANDVSLSVEEGNPEVEVNIDRDKLAQLGLDIATVGATMQNAYSGNTDAKYRVGTNEYDINIKFDNFDKRNAGDVSNICFINNKGQQIRLTQFANVEQGSGPSVLERKDRRTSVTVKSNVLGMTSGILADEINKSLLEKPLPSGVDMKWSGDIERQGDSFTSLGIALLAAIILMYLIMVALYDNYIYPIVVLISVPVAFIGSFLALCLAKSSMSMMTMLGMIMLFGLVAKNAILIVDFANHRKAEGESTYIALIQAGKTRFRPILMTTIAMVAGMLPIALASGAGAEWKNGLGWVLVGGLLSSLFLTIFLVPMAYYTVDRIAFKFKNKLYVKEVIVAQEEIAVNK